MSGQNITCSMCGNIFDPAGRSSCKGCPLQKGCLLVCCPACGYETVDPGSSAVARAFNRLLERARRKDSPDHLAEAKSIR
jgi:hypothetical protein